MPLSRRSIRSVVLSLVLSALCIAMAAGPVFAQVPLRNYDATLQQMFDALQTKSYGKFTADGDAKFKAGFTEKMFNELSRRLGPKLQQGYSVTFLTTLHQQEFETYVWKLEFKGLRDDLLVTLFVRDGNISGFVAR
jgi:hypothetical protein